MKILLRKSISTIQADALEQNKLKRSLSTLNLTVLGIGAVIGAGIFVLTGTAAAQHAGPSLVLSFVISAMGCLFAGLCYAEFAATIPVAGSAYTYGYATMGEFVAWVIGWDLILEYLFGASTVAAGWSGYVVSFLKDFNIIIPPHLCEAPFTHDSSGWHLTGAIINFPAVFVIALMTAFLVIGIKESTRFNNIVVLIKVAVILLFIGFGVSHIDMSNYTPFIPANTSGTFGKFGFTGILAGAAVVFFAYIGFDAVSTASQEATNPQKSMPRAILWTLLICTILYIAVTLVVTGIVHYSELDVAAPIAVAIDAAGRSLFWLRPIIKMGAIAGLSSVVLVLLYGQSRIFYTMSNDGLLWKCFSKTHVKFQTPYIATIIIGGLAALMAGLFPVGLLGHMVSIGTLFAFIIVSTGIIILRKTEPDLHRAFRTPFVPLVPVLAIIICLAQMIALPLDTWIRLIGWMVIGFAIYFTYGIRHSKVRKGRK
ncbi:MAG: amino acid permease [Prevotellaceae bacterium]|jgi:APA family basic amino acid/polyamine antiporter|nr:amino acid permease [Prevotellaceae bacterium]